MANLAALRAAVFSLSAKNLRGGGDIRRPGRARVNDERLELNEQSSYWEGKKEE